MTSFVPGLELNRAFYWEAVRPIFDRGAPGLRHAAALVGYGSDVLGFDTPASSDHQWGPRLEVFLLPEEFDGESRRLHEALRHELPREFRGFSTHFGDPGHDGVRTMKPLEPEQPIEHLVNFRTIEKFWQSETGLSPYDELSPTDWLAVTEHKWLSITAGAVYHDDIGLEAMRQKFAWYPDEVWRYLLAAQWALIAQEEAFPGRIASVGDDLGWRIVVARQCERLMHLCFLIERRYAPYSKWFGKGFAQLECHARMHPLLSGALGAADYPTCEPWLARAVQLAAELHNGLGITAPLDATPRTFSGWHRFLNGDTSNPDAPDTRPFLVIYAQRFVTALRETLRDPRVLALVPHAGSVNQFLVQSSNALQSVDFTLRLRDDLVG